ncbi:MAG: hypothetical protein F6J87_17960 [Spirulina sp. SIO3F2]|nr:hypothetical protein [Spirulina sp. SIO3F2]
MAYPAPTVNRAVRAWRCSPFTLILLERMSVQSVALSAIAGTAGQRNRYTTLPLLELAVESQLLWLIQVGILRREVDGQGITDCFRLTPLGRQIAEQWRHGHLSRRFPTGIERLRNFCSRWLNVF